MQVYISKKCSMDMQRAEYAEGHAALTWACSTDTQQGNAARTYSMDIQHGHASCTVHVARTLSIDMQHVESACTVDRDLPSMDMQR